MLIDIVSMQLQLLNILIELQRIKYKWKESERKFLPVDVQGQDCCPSLKALHTLSRTEQSFPAVC